jgi:hypothetical protein
LAIAIADGGNSHEWKNRGENAFNNALIHKYPKLSLCFNLVWPYMLTLVTKDSLAVRL